MRGDGEAIIEGTARLFELDDLISLGQKTDALKGALLVPQIWGGAIAPHEVLLEYTGDANIPIEPGLTVMLLRTGMRGAAAEVWGAHAYELGPDHWFAELHWSFGAEVALELGDRALGAAVYERLLPLRGGCVIAGTGPAHGPVDMYLALAAAAAGEAALASEHADAAAALSRAWNLPQVTLVLDDLRERHGF